MIADKMPPKEKLKNAAGPAYSQKVYDLLVEWRDKKRADRGLTVKTARVDAAVGDDGSDGDEQDQYHLF